MKMDYFIAPHEMHKGKIMFDVCSIDLDGIPLTIHIHDICHTADEAEVQLDLVKKGLHPTQTNPAGSFLLWQKPEEDKP